jgi:hypothetical protein
MTGTEPVDLNELATHVMTVHARIAAEAARIEHGNTEHALLHALAGALFQVHALARVIEDVRRSDLIARSITAARALLAELERDDTTPNEQEHPL